MRIVLASQSPRRHELLARMGLEFTIRVPDLDESGFTAKTPGELVELLSREKAAAAAGDGDELIIASDTVVVLDGAILGKPVSKEDAACMLGTLAGRTHEVYSGVTVRRGDKTVTEHEVTAVTFRSLSDQEIRRYIATGEPMDKAGAYGIQGCGALLVEGIRGDYFNVMGLPVNRLGRILVGFGVDCLELAARRAEESA